MKNSKQLRTWLDDMQLKHPLVIAGPCSAETEAQVLKIAHELKNSDELNYFDIKKAFDNYWEPFNVKNGKYLKDGVELKAPGWKLFKRFYFG